MLKKRTMETKKNDQNFRPSAECPIRNVLCRFGEKWPMLVLVTLAARGTMRFNELQKSIGDISQRVLSGTLRTLVEDGLGERIAYPEVPPRVEYRLTPRGERLVPTIDGVVGWALCHLDEIRARRTASQAAR